MLSNSKDDLYYSNRALKRALQTLKEDKIIAPQDKEDIKDFINSMIALGIKPIRLKKEVYILRKITHILGQSFRNTTKKEMLQIFTQIELSNYSEWTKVEFKIILKRFYKWLLGEDEYYPECVAWIKTKDPTLCDKVYTEPFKTSCLNEFN